MTGRATNLRQALERIAATSDPLHPAFTHEALLREMQRTARVALRADDDAQTADAAEVLCMECGCTPCAGTPSRSPRCEGCDVPVPEDAWTDAEGVRLCPACLHSCRADGDREEARP